MIKALYSTLLFIPLYNALVFLISIVPGSSVGIAVVVLTIVIRLILFPLSKKAIKTQLQMKQIEPELQRIREKVKDRQEQAVQMMNLYKEKEVNPFASFLLILIQFPILIALYHVFQSNLNNIDATRLYSFVQAPTTVAMSFLGADITSKGVIIGLAILAVITQFIQLNISLPTPKKAEKPSFQSDLAHSMNLQMKYIVPLIMFPVAYISAVLGLYLVTSNIFMIFQELFVRRRLEKQYAQS